MKLRTLVKNAANNAGAFVDASRVGNPKVMAHLLGPAVRGLLLQQGKGGDHINVRADYDATFSWNYSRQQTELQKLYALAKQSQWDAAVDLDWSIDVDPENYSTGLLNEELLPFSHLRSWRLLSQKEKQKQRAALLAWLLSQFLHGEQGALFAACQVTEAVESMDGKLYGATQVMDEGRHVEVFHRYLNDKLEHIYEINDNLYVILDALMTDSRWDFKFLGMQIMVEGLALGAFGTLRKNTREPLLKELLRYVITDEARHVHFGVVSLQDYYKDISKKERREREDWAFEMSLLLRNRFLCHEFYEEFYGHQMSRGQWNRMLLKSEFMQTFRKNMFRRIIPNLKRIGLLSERIKPYYKNIGLLEWENEKAAPDLSEHELVEAC